MIIHHKRNTAFELVLPIVDAAAPETFKVGASPVMIAFCKDGDGPWNSLTIADSLSEIGSSGLYQVSLSAGELNHDWVVVKASASGAADSMVTLRTFVHDIDDAFRLDVVTDAVR